MKQYLFLFIPAYNVWQTEKSVRFLHTQLLSAFENATVALATFSHLLLLGHNVTCCFLGKKQQVTLCPPLAQSTAALRVMVEKLRQYFPKDPTAPSMYRSSVVDDQPSAACRVIAHRSAIQ